MRVCHRIAFLVLLLLAWGGRADAIMLDGYAATVADTVITIGEVKKEMRHSQRDLFMAMRAGEQVSDEKLAAIYRGALDKLVAEELVLAEYRQLKEDEKIGIPEEAVESTVQGIIRDRYDNDRVAFFEDLDRTGTSFDEFKERQRRNIVMMVMRERQFRNAVSVAPGAVRKLYEERIDEYAVPAKAELSLIVVNADGDADGDRARARANQLLAGIRAGKDFAELAKAESDGSRADAGGYRGWMDIANLRSELRHALEELKPGEMSDVVAAGNGFYIIRVKDLRPPSERPLADVEQTLRSELRREAMDENMNAWVEQLEKKHYVKRYPLPTEF